MHTENEIWKEIPNYEDYHVSNLGRVKSLKYNKQIILKQAINGSGYYFTNLQKGKERKTISIHILVSIVFLDHVPCGHKKVINHINMNKLDNSVNNLEITTQRNNLTFKKINKSSKYTGVFYSNTRGKWISQIYYNKKRHYLGSYLNEIEAHLSYERFKLDNNI